MRKSIILTLVLLVSAWALAQQDTTHPNAGSSQAQSQSSDQNQGAARPGAAQAGSQSASAMPEGGSDTIEGCLGGSKGNYTVTDKSGTSYALLIPEGADASPLQKHIGESVAVQGTVDKGDSSQSSASSPAVGAQAGSSSSSAGGHAIHAMRIGRGTGQCPASSSGSGSSTTPPKK